MNGFTTETIVMGFILAMTIFLVLSTAGAPTP